MKKNYIKHLLTALLLLCCSVGFAQKFTVNGIRYNVIDKNKRWVEVAPKASEYAGYVVIPRSVTRSGVKYTVKRIGDSAFECCIELKSLTIPSTVTSIGDDICVQCESLVSIKVEAGNPVYDSRNNCNAIIETKTNTLIQGCHTTVIPYGVTSLGEGALYGCGGLKTLRLPKTLRHIGEGGLSIEHGVLEYSCVNNLVSIKVDAGNPMYDSRNNCNAVIETRTNTLIKGCKNTVIPNGVRKIVGDAFSTSDIRSIVIPSTVTDIEPNAFWFCTNLKSIKVHPSNPVYDSRNNCNAIIETSTNTLVMGFPTTVIPNTVTRIGDRAFIGSSITHITIPNSVKSLGENVFYECYDLKTITLPRHLDFNLEEQGLPDTVRIIWR